MILPQDAGILELYKKKYGKYPGSFEELKKGGYELFATADHYLKPFYYKVSDDAQSYKLCSLGPDGILGTSDDIYPE